MLATPTIYLPGHDLGEPTFATPQSAGYDLPAVLTRAFITNNDQRHFTWKTGRKKAFHYSDPDTREDYDNIVEYLRARDPNEIAKIKKMNQGFPVHYLKLKVMPGETVRVPLGIKTAIPEGYQVLLFARASSAKKEYRLGNCVGVIDSDYRDEWFAAIRNEGQEALLIEHGQKLVQAVFMKRIESSWPKADKLPGTDREGGFGSTDSTSKEPAADPMEALNEELSPDDAAQLAQQAGSMPNPLNPSQPMQETQGLLEDAATPEPAPDNEFIKIELSCMGVNIGPVAKFRPDVHSVIYGEQGAEGVASILMRELSTHLPKCLPKLVDALFAKVSEQTSEIEVPGQSIEG